jgi:hypothetical protein
MWLIDTKFISVFTNEFLYVIIVSHSQPVLNKDCQYFTVMRAIHSTLITLQKPDLLATGYSIDQCFNLVFERIMKEWW